MLARWGWGWGWGLGAWGAGGCGGGGVKGCVSHGILDLLIICQMSKCQNVKHLDYGGGSKKKNLT